MNDKIMFMIVNQELFYSNDYNMDHKEWYTKLGFKENDFDNIVRGFILEGKIIFYKGSNFQYDQDVINIACLYAPKIREKLKNPSLEVYCGIVINSQGEKWEPILKIQEEELIAESHQEKKEIKKQDIEPHLINTEQSAMIEFKNNYDDDTFVKKAILITGIVLVLTVILKIYLFSKREILHMDNRMDMLLVFLQIGLLSFCIYGYKAKMEITKYIGIIASICIILSFDILDIIIGLFYFLFTVDFEYIISMKNGADSLIEKIRKKIKDR